MEQKEWFASWFDTSYYHTLYRSRDDEEANRFIRNLLSFLSLPNEAKVLDLACGKGRHAITLSEYGLNVTGADLSANSIQLAKSAENKRLKFLVHDMRLPLADKFDAVFNLFTSFGYFDDLKDNEKVIQSVNQMLNARGIFVIDFMNAFKVVESLVPAEVKTVDGITFSISRKFDGQHIFKNIQFSDEGQNFDYTERVQFLIEKDFRNLLVANGFEIIDLFGDFDLHPFEKETSDRLIIIAQKTT